MKHVELEFFIARRYGRAICALAAIAALAATSPARADGVSLDSDGTGLVRGNGGGAAIDAHGFGFIVMQPNPLDAANPLFAETGAYELTAADGVSRLGDHDITLTYTLYGTIAAQTGQASVFGGQVTLYSDSSWNFGTTSPAGTVAFGANDGTPIASFAVTAGGGPVDGSVGVVANAIAGSLLPGYFFSGSGVDLAGSQQLQMNVQIQNAIDGSPSAAVVSEIVCKQAGFPGPGCAGGNYANTSYYFVVADQAQAVLSAVPEPASGVLALAGLGLVGAAVRRRFGNPRAGVGF